MVVILKTLGTKNKLELLFFLIFPADKISKSENKIVCILLAEWKINH
jgi:hypothetical protein